MYVEIWNGGKVVKRFKEMLGEITFHNELMYVPTFSATLPMVFTDFLTGRAEFRFYVNDKIFHGLVERYTINTENRTVQVDLQHVVHEWTYRAVATNLAIKNETIRQMYDTEDFYYSKEWAINYLGDSGGRIIDYVYSRQNKLEALNKTVELTPDLFWRIHLDGTKSIDIGAFGEKKNITISTLKSGGDSTINIRMLKEPTLVHDFGNVVNMATVYANKSDGGMSTLSLREVYNNPSLQLEGFPVIIVRDRINNERTYDYAEYPELAPNNDFEYAILDEESIAIEGGTLIEDTFAFEDLSAFQINDEEVTNEDRIMASKMAYDSGVRKLMFRRRTFSMQVTTEELPADLKVGNQIRFLYNVREFLLTNCSKYMSKLLDMDDWYYVNSIDSTIDSNGAEINRLSLSKFILTER